MTRRRRDRGGSRVRGALPVKLLNTSRLPEILHADISTISTFRGLKGNFRVGSRVCMSDVSNSMPCLRAEMSCMRDSWNHLDMSDRF